MRVRTLRTHTQGRAASLQPPRSLAEVAILLCFRHSSLIDMVAHVPKDRSSQLWSLAILAISYATLPMVLTYVFWAALWHRIVHGPKPKVPASGKTAIITGGKVRGFACCHEPPRLPSLPSRHPPPFAIASHAILLLLRSQPADDKGSLRRPPPQGGWVPGDSRGDAQVLHGRLTVEWVC